MIQGILYVVAREYVITGEREIEAICHKRSVALAIAAAIEAEPTHPSVMDCEVAIYEAPTDLSVWDIALANRLVEA